MIELLRNCSHDSEVATYIEDDGSTWTVIKASSTKTGIEALRRENAGWTWYQDIRHPDRESRYCVVDRETRSYLRLRIRYIEGRKHDYWNGLEKNSAYVAQAVRHYCAIWPLAVPASTPIHGDLSLDNIIFNEEGVHIIDWEHFNFTGGPWGLDALYLLYETFWFGTKGRRKPTRKEIAVLAENVRFLATIGPLPPEFVGRPLRALIDFLGANRAKWNLPASSFEQKLPIMGLAPEYIKALDDLVVGAAGN